ncbi:MAG: hypothetical protein JNL01_15955 [Bdellovibrionales bacterium]|nr:hypothetical protein [Bdellovibrionales bacterium]
MNEIAVAGGVFELREEPYSKCGNHRGFVFFRLEKEKKIQDGGAFIFFQKLGTRCLIDMRVGRLCSKDMQKCEDEGAFMSRTNEFVNLIQKKFSSKIGNLKIQAQPAGEKKAFFSSCERK